MKHAVILAATVLLGITGADVAPAAQPEGQGACGTPSQFEITNFVLTIDETDDSKSSTTFHYADSETQINTDCERNSTSTADAPGGSASRYRCEDGRVEFIYEGNDPTGRITMIEAACPDGSGNEASGSTTVALNCHNSTTTSTCDGTPPVIYGKFTSLEPRPKA